MQFTRILFTALLSISLLSAAPAAADGIEGIYSVSGTNPDDGGHYRGTATISRTHQTYRVVWDVGSVYIGTGILTDNVLSVSYTDDRDTWFGIASYRIKEGGDILEGRWCRHGGETLGTDLLIRNR